MNDLIEMVGGWDVVEDGSTWVGTFLASPKGKQERLYVNIMSTKFPKELATDALCDFMSRCSQGQLPKGLTDPDKLMELCVAAARRQR